MNRKLLHHRRVCRRGVTGCISFLKKHGLPFFIPLIVFIFWYPAECQAMMERVSARRNYVLDTRLVLEYSRSWGVPEGEYSSFHYGLNMTFTGFVIDARLMGVTLTGNFAQQFFSRADGSSDRIMDGFGVRFNLLSEKPRRGWLRYAPQPIDLHYNYTSFHGGSSSAYGVSMRYAFERKTLLTGKELRPESVNRNADNENQNADNENQNADNEKKTARQGRSFSIPVPTFYFDYDSYAYKTERSDTTHNRLNLRAEARSGHSDYFAEYRYEKYSSDTLAAQSLELRYNYSYYWKETNTTFDNSNRFSIYDGGGTSKGISFFDRTSWLRRSGQAGRDWLHFGAGVNYLSRDSRTDYSIDLDTAYNRFYSEVFQNYTDAAISYRKTDGQAADNVETVRNSLQYNLSDSIILTNSIMFGRSTAGPAYGATFGLQIGRRFTASPIYSYHYAETENERITTQTLSLNLSAPLFSRMSFFSRNSYTLKDIMSGTAPQKGKTLSLSANLMWLISSYNLSLGATYVEGTTEGMSIGGIPLPGSTTGITTVNAILTTALARRLNLLVYGYYVKENGGDSRTIISPELNWQWRRISLSARYTVNMAANSATEHRVFFRFTRQFKNVMRPFL